MAAVRMPPFWLRNPGAWLRQLEARFALANMTTKVTRFNQELVGLDEESIGFVAYVLEECSYSKLKGILMRMRASWVE